MKSALRIVTKHQSIQLKHTGVDMDIEASLDKGVASIMDTEVIKEAITISIEVAKEDIRATTEVTMGTMIDLLTLITEEISYGIIMGN